MPVTKVDVIKELKKVAHGRVSTVDMRTLTILAPAGLARKN